ncbi:DIP1984 family protein [Moraxella oblonga]|uniref:DIP1984 family protein n=1 Tax=Moraxella oblonga TaxID=200413 RepID=UPI000830274F|nr:DIP1984 family protein [Moraxella oblonga]
MKLAEALLLRADLQKKLASLKSRLAENVKVQEGDDPDELPDELLITANQIIGELYVLIEKIHKTNSSAILENGKSLLSVLNERDELVERHKLLLSAIESSKTESDRYSYREIKWQKQINVKALQKQADDIAIKLRHSNIAIQSANWQIELVE